jgi:NAD(P)-dependent dehydrogenase (short-subunit alcohol dehydrogenase family)
MHRQGHGAIVKTASVGGMRGVGNQSGYSASKHGVVGLTRNSAVEYGQFGISGEAPFINGAVITIDGGQSYKY